MSISVGVILEGLVTGITNFGAFVELPGEVTGLVHISEVADSYVKDVKDFLKEKDKIKVKVINIDEKGKIGLSIKQVNSPKEGVKPRGDYNHGDRPRGDRPRGADRPRGDRSRGDRSRSRAPETFEDKLAKFLKESDEIQLEFRKSLDTKRGGRGSGRY